MRVHFRSKWILFAAAALVALTGAPLAWMLAQQPAAGRSNLKPQATTQVGRPPGTLRSTSGTRSPSPYPAAESSALAAGYGPDVGAGGEAMNDGAKELHFALISSDGERTELTATRLYRYQMVHGAAKPKRLPTEQPGGAAAMGGGYGSEMGGYDAMGMGGYGGGMPSTSGSAASGPGAASSQDLILWAYVFDELPLPSEGETSDEAETGDSELLRPQIKVVVPWRGGASSGAGYGMSAMTPYGYAGMPAGPIGAAEEGMGMMGMSGEPHMQPLEDSPLFLTARESGRKSAEDAGEQRRRELANIAQLVRLDIWIRDAQTLLQARRNDAGKFAAAEQHLKTLLAEEYDAQLAKQRSDVARLRAKLEQLQADLDRRAQAKERVVAVQLGQLVLEAQGLLGEER